MLSGIEKDVVPLLALGLRSAAGDATLVMNAVSLLHVSRDKNDSTPFYK